MPSMISAASFLFILITVMLVAIADASLANMDDKHPMLRYRSQLSPFTGLYLKPTSKRLRVEQLEGNSRNCFFSPIQCRLPVAEIAPQPMENTRSRFRRQKFITIPSSNGF